MFCPHTPCLRDPSEFRVKAGRACATDQEGEVISKICESIYKFIWQSLPIIPKTNISSKTSLKDKKREKYTSYQQGRID